MLSRISSIKERAQSDIFSWTKQSSEELMESFLEKLTRIAKERYQNKPLPKKWHCFSCKETVHMIHISGEKEDITARCTNCETTRKLRTKWCYTCEADRDFFNNICEVCEQPKIFKIFKGYHREERLKKWREEQQKSNGTLKDEEHNNRWLCFQCNQWGNFEFITIEETTNNVIAECPHCGQIRSKNSPAHPYKSQTGPRLSYANTCKRCGERDYFFLQVGQYNGIAGYCPTCEHPLYHKGTRKQPYGNTLKTSKETIKQSKLRKEREKLKDIRNFYIKI